MTFDELLQLLVKNEIRFIVIGGVACALNGFVRATEDVDIIVEPSDKNISKMLDVLSKWGEGFSNELSLDDFSVSPGAIRIIEDFPLDIFTELDGKSYNDFLPHTKENIDGITYLDANGLIELKSNTFREKDKIDVLALKRILEEE